MSLQDRIEQTVELAKEGQKDAAREQALHLVREFPEEADAWALLSQIVDSPDLAAYCLKKVLEFSDNGRVLGWAEARLAEIDPSLIPDHDPFDLYDPSNLLKGDFFTGPQEQAAQQIDHEAASQVAVRPPDDQEGNPVLLGAVILGIVLLIGVGSLLLVNGVIGPNSGRANISTIPTQAASDLSPVQPANPAVVQPTQDPLPTQPLLPTVIDVPGVQAPAGPTVIVLPTETPTPTTEAVWVVRLLEPQADAILSEDRPQFQWVAIPDAARYQVDIVIAGTEANIYNNTVNADDCQANLCSLAGPPLDDGRYVWSVQASTDVDQQDAVRSSFEINRSGSAGGVNFELGGQVPGGIARPALMQGIGMQWVKFQVIYGSTPAEDVKQLVDQGRQYGFKVLLSITGETFPEEIDFAGYNAYLAQVATYQPDAIEVWNEMNLETEWPVGEISPQQYVDEMLAPAYATIKQASPSTIVIIGALASTGVDNKVTVWSDNSYIDGLNDADAANFADCMGTHHNGGATSPRVQTGHPADQSGHHSWYYLPTLEVAYEGMDQKLPLCITELGYLTPDGYPPLAQDWLWAQDTTVEEQAAWLAEGVEMARELGYVRFVIIWNIDFSRYDIDPQGGFAILRPDETCPACATLTQAMQP